MINNFLTSVAAAVTGGFVVSILRPKLKTKVNCWFCAENSYVKFSDRNRWNCPTCGQYNGFNDNGDYNKEVPGQLSDEPKIWKIITDKKQSQPAVKKLSFSNGLCDTCNQNQMLKINVLKNYVPHSKNVEALEYMNRINRIFALCDPCKTYVDTKLELQDRQLSYQYINKKNLGPIQYKDSKTTKSSRQNYIPSFFRYIVLFISLFLLPLEINTYWRYFDFTFNPNLNIYSSDMTIFDIQVIFQILAVFFTESSNRLVVDIICCILWIATTSPFINKISSVYTFYWPFHIMVCVLVSICCCFGKRCTGELGISNPLNLVPKTKASRLPKLISSRTNKASVKPLQPDRSFENLCKYKKRENHCFNSSQKYLFDHTNYNENIDANSAGLNDFTRHMHFLKLGFNSYEKNDSKTGNSLKLFDYHIENVDTIPKIANKNSLIFPSHFKF